MYFSASQRFPPKLAQSGQGVLYNCCKGNVWTDEQVSNAQAKIMGSRSVSINMHFQTLEQLSLQIMTRRNHLPLQLNI